MVDHLQVTSQEAVTANGIIVGLNEAIGLRGARADAEDEWRMSDG